ncbi:MAG: cbb3-type cytochrome oxidase assembly protein [Armatimonadetes bacterium]|nr:cbb3-type cytochrome oxidase assembly protein [Armatimonadota bacterium]
MTLILCWTLYALLATALFSAFFLWAVRAGQFADQDRARYLPLATVRGGVAVSHHEGHDEREGDEGQEGKAEDAARGIPSSGSSRASW